MAKQQSVNYTAPGTNFPIASEAADPLKKEDVFTLQRALEEHSHDNTRGTEIRRINTAPRRGRRARCRSPGTT